MTFQSAVSTCLSKYATFSGRAARSEFWWFVLFQFAVQLVAALIDITLWGSAGGEPVQMVASLALFLPTLAVAVRRLHDNGRKGWWIFLGLVPIIGILVLLYWYVQPSQSNANDFGPVPS